MYEYMCIYMDLHTYVYIDVDIHTQAHAQSLTHTAHTTITHTPGPCDRESGPRERWLPPHESIYIYICLLEHYHIMLYTYISIYYNIHIYILQNTHIHLKRDLH